MSGKVASKGNRVMQKLKSPERVRQFFFKTKNGGGESVIEVSGEARLGEQKCLVGKKLPNSREKAHNKQGGMERGRKSKEGSHG